MTCLTLKDLRSTGNLLLVECVRCGALEYRSASSVTGPAHAAVGALGLGLTCRCCGVMACITSPVPARALTASSHG